MFVIRWMLLYPQSEARVWKDENGKPMVFETRTEAQEMCAKLMEDEEYARFGLCFEVDWNPGYKLQFDGNLGVDFT